MSDRDNSISNSWHYRISYLWFVPILYYFFNIGRYATNTPYGGDDIVLIVGRTAQILSAPDFMSTLPYLFSISVSDFHSEYQTFFITLSGIVSTWVLGYIDLQAITLVGNAGLFAAIFFLVYKLAKSSDEFNVLALIAFLFLAAPIYGDCSIWANCTIGQFGSIFMGSVVSLFLVRSGMLYFILFEIGMIAAVLTQGNGMAFLPMGFLGIWLFQQERLKKNLYLAHGVIAAAVLGFTTAIFDNTASSLMHDAIMRSLGAPLVLLKMIPLWALGWFGSWAAYENNLVMAVCVGLIEVSLLVYVFIRYKVKIFYAYPHASLFILYLVATITITAISRAFYIGENISYLFSDRYKTYSLCTAICLMMLMLSMIRDGILIKVDYWRSVAGGLSLFGLVYFIAVNVNKQQFYVAFKRQQLQCAAEWEETGLAKPCKWHGDNKVLMDKAVNMHILYIDKNGGSPLRCDGNPAYTKYCWK